MSLRAQIVVMKFGGTSVEDAAAMRRTAAIVAGRRARGCSRGGGVRHGEGDRPAAGGGRCGGRGERAGALAIARGCGAARGNGGDAAGVATCSSVVGQLHAEFDALDDLLRGIAAVGELTPRTNDLVVSFGERLSSRMVAAAFAEQGLRGAHVDARTAS